MSTLSRDYLQLHFIVLIWGVTAILGVLIETASIELVFYRAFISFVALGIILYFRKRKFYLGVSELLKIIGTGVLISFHWVLFFASAKVSTVSVCLAGIATTTLWTSLLEPVIRKKQIKWYEVMLGLSVIVGLYVVFSFEFNHLMGLVLAIASAFFSALFSVINSKFAIRQNPYIITFYEMIGAFLGTVMLLPFSAWFFSEGHQVDLLPSGIDLMYLAILALVCTVYPFAVSVELMKRLSVFAINLTVNLEPVYGIILAVIVFGEKEKMTQGFYWGTAIILLSVFIHPVLDRYYKRKRKVRTSW